TMGMLGSGRSWEIGVGVKAPEGSCAPSRALRQESVGVERNSWIRARAAPGSDGGRAMVRRFERVHDVAACTLVGPAWPEAARRLGQPESLLPKTTGDKSTSTP